MLKTENFATKVAKIAPVINKKIIAIKRKFMKNTNKNTHLKLKDSKARNAEIIKMIENECNLVCINSINVFKIFGYE